jgi:uncharacterized protein YdhG (YjbR/CyaY superfamily)
VSSKAEAPDRTRQHEEGRQVDPVEFGRAVIAAVAPDATETISYAIPTFNLNGTHLVHFAGYERHIRFYPTPSGIAAFRDELRPYKSAKGSVQFPLGQPLPADLIRRITAFRVEEVTARHRGSRQSDRREGP